MDNEIKQADRDRAISKSCDSYPIVDPSMTTQASEIDACDSKSSAIAIP